VARMFEVSVTTVDLQHPSMREKMYTFPSSRIALCASYVGMNTSPGVQIPGVLYCSQLAHLILVRLPNSSTAT